MRYVSSMIAVMTLVVSACAAAEPAPDPGAAPQPETTTTTITTLPESDEDSSAVEDPSAVSLQNYLVAMVNIEADDCSERAEQEFNASLPDNFEPATEEEALEHARRYMEGQLFCWNQVIDAMAALEAPSEAAAAHGELVAARRAYVAEVTAAVDEAQTFDDAFGALFEPPPDVLAVYVAWVDACVALEDVAVAAGFDVSLSCPLPPPGDVGQVTVVIDASGWVVEPSPVVEDAGAGVQITIENRTDETQPVVIVDVFSGRSDDLPTVDGVLDRSRCNQTFDDGDPNPSPANFGCPELEGEGLPIPVHEVHPGESFTLEPAGVGTHVILDYRAGAYEAGNYAVVEVVETD